MTRRLILAATLATLLLLTVASATQANDVYLPWTPRYGREWFTEFELQQAMRDAGYDPAVVTQHTYCIPAEGNTEAERRYHSCYQDLTPDVLTDNALLLYWWSMEHERMVWHVIAWGDEVQP